MTSDPKGDSFTRPAYLFAAGLWRAVADTREHTVLPEAPNGKPWTYEGTVALGVRDVELPGTEPEPVITGLVARGHYIWHVSTDETAAL